MKPTSGIRLFDLFHTLADIVAKSFARLVEKYSFARFAIFEEDDEEVEEQEKACERASGEENVCPISSSSPPSGE